MDYAPYVADGIWGVCSCLVWVLPLAVGWNVFINLARRGQEAVEDTD